jgi:hypothetical protein
MAHEREHSEAELSAVRSDYAKQVMPASLSEKGTLGTWPKWFRQPTFDRQF